MRALISLVVLLASGCNRTPPLEFTGPSPLMAVEQTESFVIEGLEAPVTVVYTTGGIPQIYAHNRDDLSRAQGFVFARDRFFQLDLARRLSQGTLSELLGDFALPIDIESRAVGMSRATDIILENATDEHTRLFELYADGVNQYIDQVQAGALPPPSELEFAGALLGSLNAADHMTRFTARDVAAIGGTLLYRLGYETGDIGRTDDYLSLVDSPGSGELGDLRKDLSFEIWGDVRPVYDHPSAAGLGTQGTGAPAALRTGRLPAIDRSLLSRARSRATSLQDRLGRDHVEGWGSNAWAVAGSHTVDGRALLAGDGHLELDIPALMYQIGLDTMHLGGGEIAQQGLVLVGMPVLSVGTNGKVAWSTTQHSGDITDWYSEEVTLGADGLPSSTLFRGENKDIVRVDETYEVAEVVALGSVARTEVWPRFQTFDGRWLYDIEGREIDDPVMAGSDEVVVNMAGSWIVPGDLDNDGRITAISFDFTGFDPGNLLGEFDEIGQAQSVAEIHEATRMSQALSQNLVAADVHGDIYYTGYEMVPCRDMYPRDANGRFELGSDPTMLLDGTQWGAFEIPVDQNLHAIEGDPDPSRCVIPFDQYPKSFTPPEGFLLTANQDPGGFESDGNLFNDGIYIGGPWDDGYRAHTIHTLLTEATTTGTADLVTMSEIQNHHDSAVGLRHAQDLLDAIDHARQTTPTSTGSDGRIFTLYENNKNRFDESYDRLSAWLATGARTPSGVVTFYNPEVSEAERSDAVATSLFNVWLGDLVSLTLDDEGLPGDVWQGGGSAGRLRVLHRMFADRGPNNPGNSAGWNPATEESVFFDLKDTAGVIETSDEISLMALSEALDFLASEFSTDNMDNWVWGLLHQVEFQSLVGAYVDEPLLAGIFEQFAINTDRLPLIDNLTFQDPRHDLEWFPRPCDNRCVDAANPGLSGRSFRYGSGPVMRMAFALGPNGIDGVNIIPGGQSGIQDSEFYDDQAELWLGNETIDLPTTPEEVAADGLWRMTLRPW